MPERRRHSVGNSCRTARSVDSAAIAVGNSAGAVGCRLAVGMLAVVDIAARTAVAVGRYTDAVGMHCRSNS